ncbi:MAG: sigma-E processing peptidase SpoIIGA [Clostridia bacterium]|nr:sigma-E processing peptidase SpoIIGA [Clostridia bacterium]
MYIEEILLENIVVNSFLVLIYISFINLNITKRRVIFSIIYLSIFSVLIKIYSSNVIIYSILINVSNIYILEGKTCFKIFIKRNIYFLVLYFLYVGVIFFEILIFDLNISKILNRLLIYSFNGIILKVLTDILWKMWISKIKFSLNIYEVVIKNIGKFKMFIDTGNFASYKEEIPVIIINEESYLKKVKKRKKYIYTMKDEEIIIKTLTGYCTYKGYVFKELIIKKRGEKGKNIKDALIIFTKEKIENNIFDGILPANILIEK